MTIETENTTSTADAPKTYPWRVLKLADWSSTGKQLWEEVAALDSRYWSGGPDAEDLGKLAGEGTYLLCRADEKYDVREVVIVAEKLWREAPDEAPGEDDGGEVIPL
jgi:hypothetical protein